MADLALERLKVDDKMRQWEIGAIRKQALEALEPPACHFSKLPTEICSTIFTMIAERSEARTLALTLVCRSWRAIILDTPALWRRFILSRKTPSKKIEAWLERSKGRITHLDMFEAFKSRQEAFKKFRWKEVKALTIGPDVMDLKLKTTLPSGILEQLRLEELNLQWDSLGVSPLGRIIEGLEISMLNALTVRGAGISKTMETLAPLTSLTKLRLELPEIPSAQMLAYLEQSTILEELALTTTVAPFKSTFQSESLLLDKLRRLDLKGRGTHTFLEAINCPNLERISMDSSGGVDWIPQQSFPKLKQLTLVKCRISYQELHTFLEKADSLDMLEICACYPKESTQRVVEELGRILWTTYAPQGHYLCPRLQHLNFKGSSELRSMYITQVVKTRLEGHAAAKENSLESPTAPSCLLIQSLNIEDCLLVSPDALPWLRKNVSQLYYKMNLAKKADKGRTILWL